MRRQMGFWPFDSSSEADDESNGLEALTAYWEEASPYPSFPYSSLEHMLADFEAKVPGYIKHIGELIRITNASQSFSDAVENLKDAANRSEGKLSLVQIVQVAGGKGDTLNWGSLIPEVAIASASDIAKQATEIAQSVGTGVLGTVKMAKYLPLILLAGGAVFLFAKSGGLKRKTK